MVPVFITLEGYLDVIPTIEALIDSGYESDSDVFRSSFEFLSAKSIEAIRNAESVIILMGRSPQTPLGFWYK